MVEQLKELTKKDFLDYGIRAALLVGALAGHFFLVQAKVDILAEKMEKMERVYERVINEVYNDKATTEGFRSKYISQIEGNTKRVEMLEQQVQGLRETNREILTVLREIERRK